MASVQDINTYIKEFPEFCRQEIMPIMVSFEQERLERKKKNSVFIASFFVLPVLVVLLIFLGPKNNTTILVGFVLGVVGFFVIASMMGKNSADFENKVKLTVMGKLLSFFGDFSWTTQPKITRDEVVKAKLFYDFDSFYIDDNFEGTYKGQNVVISEICLKKTVHTRSDGNDSSNTKSIILFSGVFVKISMNKNFSSHTVIVDKDSSFEKAIEGQNVLVNSLISSISNGSLNIGLGGNSSKEDFYKRSKMESVILEDPEFCEMFEVYSTDQVDSRYILTTTFIERFKLLSKSMQNGGISACFLNNSVIFAIPSMLSMPELQALGVKPVRQEKDLFLLGDLNTPMTDTVPLQDFFKQFIAALALVDSLKLDQKIGL